MSNCRIGQIAFIKNIDLGIPPCYAAYFIDNKLRNNCRVYSNLKLILLNKSYVDKTTGLFKLKQDEINTLHKENGLYFYLNILHTYFNPNYAHFRKRLSQLIHNSTCIVLGDGVGPFSIYLANCNNIVIGYEYNKKCYIYSLINKKINKIGVNYIQVTKDIKQVLINTMVDVVISIMPFQILNYIFHINTFKFKVHYCVLFMDLYKLGILMRIIKCKYTIILTKDYSKYGKIYLLKIMKLAVLFK